MTVYPKQKCLFKKQPDNKPFCFPIAIINAHIWNGTCYPSLSKLVHDGHSINNGTSNEKGVLNKSDLHWSHKVNINLVIGNKGIAVFKTKQYYHASFVFTKNKTTYVTNPQFTNNTIDSFSNLDINLTSNSYGYLLYTQRNDYYDLWHDHES
jgi:hypothetical protein